MTTQLAAETESFEADVRRFEESAEAAAPDWLWGMRRDGLRAFSSLGMPTSKDEDWLYTNVAPLRAQPLPRAPQPVHAPAELASQRFALGLDQGPRLVFLNGRFEPALSNTGTLPESVTALNLAAAVQLDSADVKRHLGLPAHAEMHPFAALNTAYLQDGAYLEIPPGCEIDDPIQLVFLHTPTGRAVAVHPRVLVVAGPNSKVTLVERYGIDCIGALAGGTCFTNAVTEFILGDGAKVRNVRVQREGTRTYHIGLTAVRQNQDSLFESTSVSLGGTIDRHEMHVELLEEGAECRLSGLYVIANKEHADTHTVVRHRVPHCESHQLFKGILGGKAAGAFTGRVVVHPKAQKTNATQANHNLLLSEGALAETRPQLEIYADDVKCTHGATIGQLDEEALYYLRSRGLGPLMARNLLVHAFAGEVTRTVGDEKLEEGLRALLAARLEADPKKRRIA